MGEMNVNYSIVVQKQNNTYIVRLLVRYIVRYSEVIHNHLLMVELGFHSWSDAKYISLCEKDIVMIVFFCALTCIVAIKRL